MYIFDSQTFKPLDVISGLPHPEYGAIFALGPRWLAYQSTLPVPESASASCVVIYIYSFCTHNSHTSPRRKLDTQPGENGSGATMQYYRNLLQTTTSKDLLDMTNQGIMNAMWYGTKTVQKLYNGYAVSTASATPLPSLSASERSRDMANAAPGVVRLRR